MKPFLVLQLRPVDAASDSEFEAMLRWGQLDSAEVRRVRMESEGVPPLDLHDYSAIIVGGGPSNVSDTYAQQKPYEREMNAGLQALLARVVEEDFPYLGVCYGLGALATYLGCKVAKGRYSEGVEALTIHLSGEGQKDPLLEGLPKDFRAFAGHKESCQALPEGAVLLASSDVCPVHFIRVKENIYATQFHPELDVEGMVLRINTYKHAGYFPPEEAEPLIEKALQETVTVPAEILRRFVERYRRD